MKILSVQLLTDDDSESVEVTAESKKGNEEQFIVQLVDNKHRSDLGCWVTTWYSDGEIDCDDFPDFDIDEIIWNAERFAKNEFNEKYNEEEI